MMKPPCHKCLTISVCRNEVKFKTTRVDFEKDTTKNAMASCIFEISLYVKCVLIERYLHDDNWKEDYPKTALVLKEMNL